MNIEKMNLLCDFFDSLDATFEEYNKNTKAQLFLEVNSYCITDNGFFYALDINDKEKIEKIKRFIEENGLTVNLALNLESYSIYEGTFE